MNSLDRLTTCVKTYREEKKIEGDEFTDLEIAKGFLDLIRTKADTCSLEMYLKKVFVRDVSKEGVRQ